MIAAARAILRDEAPDVPPRFRTFERDLLGLAGIAPLQPDAGRRLRADRAAARRRRRLRGGRVRRGATDAGDRRADGARREIGGRDGAGPATGADDDAGRASAIGVMGSFAAARTIRSLLFGVVPTDPLTFARWRRCSSPSPAWPAISRRAARRRSIRLRPCDASDWSGGSARAPPCMRPAGSRCPPANCGRIRCSRRSLAMPQTASSSRRWFLGALVLAATLPSCGRGADTPPPATGRPPTRPRRHPAAPAPPPPPPPRELTWSGKVDMKLWSPGRVKAYKAALQQETPPTLAILRIPRLKLEVPVYDGTTDAVLDLAAGRIEDTALPGTAGNVGIAAHRDGFFRVLKDIKEGDALVLDTPVATEQYRVEWIRITTPDDVSVIDPTPGPAVTLVGCYPFYHVGPAPQRFIVRAVPAAALAVERLTRPSRNARLPGLIRLAYPA